MEIKLVAVDFWLLDEMNEGESPDPLEILLRLEAEAEEQGLSLKEYIESCQPMTIVKHRELTIGKKRVSFTRTTRKPRVV